MHHRGNLRLLRRRRRAAAATVARAGRCPGVGPVRLLDVDKALFLVVADLPLDRYSETASTTA